MESSNSEREFLPFRPTVNSLLPLKRELSTLPPRKSVNELQHIGPANNPSNLTRKQKKFVENYLRGMTDKDAALKAGYAKSVADNAWIEIRNKPVVQRELRRRMDEQYRDEELTTDEIINGWRHVIDYNLLDYGYINQENGQFVVDFRNSTREQMSLIEGIDTDAYNRQKIRLPSKHAARESLAKYKKILGDDKGSGESGKLTIESLDGLVRNFTQNNITINQIQERKELPQVIEAEIR